MKYSTVLKPGIGAKPYKKKQGYKTYYDNFHTNKYYRIWTI